MKGGKKVVKRLFQFITISEKFVISYTMLVISLLVFLQVLTRYVFEYSTPWLEELTRFLMIWMVLIGSSLAVKTNKHITIDMLDLLLKRDIARKLYQLFINTIGIIFSAFLIYYSFEVVMRTATYDQVSGAMRVPMYLVNGSFLVGGILIFIHYIERIIGGSSQDERGD